MSRYKTESPRAKARRLCYKRAWQNARNAKLPMTDVTLKAKEAVMEFDRLNPPLEMQNSTALATESPNGEVASFALPTAGSPKKIFWTLTEMKAVATNLAAKMREQGLRHVPEQGDRVGNGLVIDFLRIAQSEVLPKERRRVGPNLFRSMFKEVFWEQVELALTAKTAALEPLPEPPPKAKEEPAPADTKLSEVPLAKLLIHGLTELLGRLERSEKTEREFGELKAAQELGLEEMQKLRGELGELRAQVANGSNMVTIPIPKKVLPRVAIVGCQRYEFDHIKEGAEKRGMKLDFRHYDQEAKPSIIHADYAIGLKWMNHSWQAQMEAAISNRDHFIFINGGIGLAIRKLEEWFPVHHE